LDPVGLPNSFLALDGSAPMSDSPSLPALEARIADLTRQLSASQEEVAQLRAELDQRNRALGLLHESLTIQSTIDALTGLFNRREFRNRMMAEWGRYKRHKRPLSLLLFDLDQFKLINEQHGKECGDTVLQAVGAIFRSKQRRHDVDCRYGGEEFAILLPETSLDQAFLVATQLKRRIEETRYPYKDSEIRVTVTVGVSNAPEQHPQSDEDLIRLAEQGKVRAKSDGNGHIIAVDPLDPKQILRRQAPLVSG
jgi:diguanylate cyclase (GGDEF)-like protein